MKPAATEAVNWPELTNAVGKMEPFHSTLDPEVNPEP
jgi:hypothetical protein